MARASAMATGFRRWHGGLCRLGLAAMMSLLVSTQALAASVQPPPGERLQAYYDSITTLQGRFEQQVIAGDGSVADRYEGRFWLAKPGRFCWLYAPPFGQQLYSDGEQVWIFDPDLEQVIVRPSVSDEGVSPAYLLAGGVDLGSRFEVAAAPDDDGWLILKPRPGSDTQAAAAFVELRLRLQPVAGVGADQQLTAMVMQDALGQTTRFTFHDVERNLVIDPGRFVFHPPPGVDVIRE